MALTSGVKDKEFEILQLLRIQDSYSNAILICEAHGWQHAKRFYIEERIKINEEIHKIGEAK